MTFSSIITVIAVGFSPSLIWLYFILKEDSRNPEPKRIIALAFFAGMLCVPIVLPLEQYAQIHFGKGFSGIVAWATIEETTKYALAALLILWRPAVDEPLDYVIYLITIALGFAALENALFIFTPIMSGHTISGLITGDLRFLGSTLLHVVASATIGFALAFSYMKTPLIRMFYVSVGVILAITLHASFNLLIMSTGGLRTFDALLLVWSGAVVVLALLEVVKYRTYKNLPNFYV
ncbi:MAG TPA: PrsW family intramembrane metalloprotease [Candidatus Kaiserbacteria bacterium]|nr:PrsW family intramembrane metalloprotease [Candidatus Kaiserbacteria bacterium]